MIGRSSDEIEAMGKMAAVLDDVTPLQLFSEGWFGGTRFTVLGRLRLKWDEGYWNEWNAWFDDGRQGWLAEAQGFFMMSFPAPPEIEVPARGGMGVGKQVKLGAATFEVDDIKQAECVGSEGELPFRAPIGRVSTTIDLSDLAGTRFASIDFSPEGSALYLGSYVTLKELKASRLRVFDGW